MREQISKSNTEKKTKINEFDLSHSYGICYSSNSDDEIQFDLDDYNRIKDHCWEIKLGDNGYKRAVTSVNKKIVTMAFVLTNMKRLDHIDRNPLNNQRLNLRIATYQQNSSNRSKQTNNTSGVSGVTYASDREKWRSFLDYNSKTIRLGSFINFDDAVIARLQAEKQYYGEFAPQKHLYEQYGIT